MPCKILNLIVKLLLWYLLFLTLQENNTKKDHYGGFPKNKIPFEERSSYKTIAQAVIHGTDESWYVE